MMRDTKLVIHTDTQLWNLVIHGSCIRAAFLYHGSTRDTQCDTRNVIQRDTRMIHVIHEVMKNADTLMIHTDTR